MLNTRIAPCLAHALLLATALGCRPEPPPAEPGAGTISIVGEAPAPVVAESSTAESSTSPLDLVEQDGELLMHIDVASARESVAYELVKEMFTAETRELRKMRDQCGMDLFDVVDVAAASAHIIEQETPLIIAKMNADKDRILSCAKSLFKGGDEVVVAGNRAIEVRGLGRDSVLLVSGDLLFVGHQTEIKRALERTNALGGELSALRKRLPLSADTMFAVVLETGSGEVSKMSMSVSRQGQKVAVEGHATFRDSKYRKAGDYARRLERDLNRGTEHVVEYFEKFLGPAHSALSDLNAATFSRDGTTVRGQVKLTLSPTMKAEFDRAAARMGQHRQTREAKNAVGAMARGAAAAYERERFVGNNTQSVHSLCSSAVDVPSKVPRGVKYQPSSASGKDYESGTADAGWRCLKFAMTLPHAYQYSYRQGGNYKGPSRGGPDPGPDGFEVSAEGDLDGDGKTSLFTYTGTVDSSGRLRRSRSMFISDEFE